MKLTLYPILALLFALLFTSFAWAQSASPAAADDPFRDAFFPPELVMQSQQALGMTDEQKTYFRTEFGQAQARFAELQWKLQGEMERLVTLAKQPAVDEQQTLAQLDKVLAAERDVKRMQVTLLLRIKNHLRPEQQAQLRDIQSKSRK